MKEIKEYLTFDDVLLVPDYSEVLPHQVDISTRITKKIKLNTPIISAAMDSVTEADMAIAMAQNGGIGCIHKNLSIAKQKEEVVKVKKFESGMVVNPITIEPDALIRDALKLMEKHHISGIPVVNKNKILKGIITNRDVRFVADKTKKVSDVMTKDNLVTVHLMLVIKKLKSYCRNLKLKNY